MADSACLRRSFSNPSKTSHDFSEGDPLRALGESVSFGRYTSESLAWEKRSCFSHNRYLEEAEKYSKPGSVAQMKELFEAHYRRVRSKKQAPQEQEHNESQSMDPKVEDATHVELPSSSPTLNSETELANNHPTIHEVQTEDISKEKFLSRVSASSGYSAAQGKEVEIEEASTVESGANIDTLECSLEVQTFECEDAGVNIDFALSSADIKENQCEDAQRTDISPSTLKRKVTVDKNESDKKSLVYMSQQVIAGMSDKRSNKGNVSKLSSSLSRLATPVRPKKERNHTPYDGNVSKLSSSLARLATPKTRSTKEVNGIPNNRTPAKLSTRQNKPTSSSAHLSINFNSDINHVKKPSPGCHKTEIGKVLTPLSKIVRGSFVTSPTACRASVNNVARYQCATPQSETKRSRVTLGKSFARDRTLDQKLKSPSVVNLKSSMQSPSTFSLFTFRTEERAAKRREFLQQRLEKEAENLQLMDKAKVKVTANSRNPSLCRSLKTNAMVDIRAEVLSENIKIPISRPQPPNESKPSSNFIRGKCSRPPQSSIGSKADSENSKPSPTTLLTKKKRHENASPNIL